MKSGEPDDRRLEQLTDWVGSQLVGRTLKVGPPIADASHRRYFRVQAGADSWIAMDAPPERIDSQSFVAVERRLRDAGVHVPDIVASDLERGFLLLEDLGQRPYHQALDAGNAAALLDQAADALITIQRRADAAGLPEYDAGLLAGELDLFPTWFVRRHWRVEPSNREEAGWKAFCERLIKHVLAQPRVFCHRDYMPRNLMLCDPNPGILDFQDAVLGPISYDPVCLYRDAFLSWPPHRVDTWLEAYRRKAELASLPVPNSAERWRRDCDLMGVQRHLKVLGIFARIRYRDGKPRYLNDAARFFDYLDQALARNAELEELGVLLSSWAARARPELQPS